MEKEWATDAFDSLFHKDTETGIPKVPQEIFQLLDDHIAKTHKLSLSPVKKVFEGRLNSWERKLRLTQVHTEANIRSIRLFLCLIVWC